MVVGESKRPATATSIMEGIENTGDVRLHDHRLRLKQRFDIVRKLGQGTYGKVQLGINKKTGQEVAIKTIKKCKIESDADLVRIRREVQIMSSVRHPNIVHIYEVFENSEKMILVMEYCSGGELYDYLSQQKVLPEDEARRLFRQISTAVYYCHIHKICHRDLKLENVLLDETGSAKIADFGLSNVFKETSLLSTFCGSPLYASPEIVKGTPYIGPEVDCWSLGVLLYTLVYGAMPFDGSNFKRLVRQISNGDYFEPKNPSSASPLIRDMLTVDPVQRADITYICDHPWVNVGFDTSCLVMAEGFATQTPVRLDLLLSLAPPAPANSLMLPADSPQEGDTATGEDSGADLTTCASSMTVEPSSSAEKRILDLVAEGGADAIKPSPTRTIVSATEANKRKLEQAASTGSATAIAPHRKRERVASSARLADLPPSEPSVPEEPTQRASPEAVAEPALALAPVAATSPHATPPATDSNAQPTLRSSATITTVPNEAAKEESKEKSTGARPRVAVKKKLSPTKTVEEKMPTEKADAKLTNKTQDGAEKTSNVAATTDKLSGLSLDQLASAPANHSPTKPKKLSIAGTSVGSFKEQFERRASLTSPPDVKKNLTTKPVTVTSKIAKPKAQSEEREVSPKAPETGGAVRLQQIGVEPSASLPVEESSHVSGGVKKTESEPGKGSPPDPALSLQDARRSLQNSMAMLSEGRTSEDPRRRAAREVISTAIRTGKPPMPYGRSSSAGVTSLSTPPATPPAAPLTAAPRTFRTEALVNIGDHRSSNRGTSVERIIPIQVAPEDPSASSTPMSPVRGPLPATTKSNAVPLRRLVSNTSTLGSEHGSSSSLGGSSTGEPIKKSAREFIIPIAVEGKGYVTPRQGSLEPEVAQGSSRRLNKPRRISLVSGGESEEEDDTHMHRLRSTRAARAESVSSGEEEDEEGFHLLTAENLFSTLLHRVRALTNRLNGEEGTGFPQHPHSLFNNLQSPFFNSPHLPRRHRNIREGWGATSGPRDLTSDLDSMFSKRTPFPRGSNKKSSKQQTNAQQKTEKENILDLSDLDLSSIQLSEKELETLSGLTPALSRRLQKQLLAHLPPAAARTLRRTLSLHSAAVPALAPPQHRYTRSLSAKSTPPDVQTNVSSAESQNIHAKPIDTEASEVVDQSVTSSESTEDKSKTTDNSRNESQENGLEEEKLKVEENACNVAKSSTALPTTILRSSTPIKDSPVIILQEQKDDSPKIYKYDSKDLDLPQFCTLPRLKRHSVLSRETTPVRSDNSFETSIPKLGIPSREVLSRGSSVRSTPDRSLLSKYLTPERTLPMEEFSSDSGSLLSEPSYIAAYGTPALSSLPTVGSLRRHSLRLQGDQSPRKRISRFLRPDFFDTPRDESVYIRTKQDKELETQKILKEIREKRNRSADTSSSRSPATENDVQQLFKDENLYSRSCLSPINTYSRERSRSSTPFLPMLHNIKETALDLSAKSQLSNEIVKSDDNIEKENDEISSISNSKYIRPKSVPIKNITDNIGNTQLEISLQIDKSLPHKNSETKSTHRESKLLRPKSYPSSSPSPEKVFITRATKTDDNSSELPKSTNDIEVSFNVNLSKKEKPVTLMISESIDDETKVPIPSSMEKILSIKTDSTGDLPVNKETEEGDKISLKSIPINVEKPDVKNTKLKKSENRTEEKKLVNKKKVVKKVSSKSKSVENGSANQESADAKYMPEKKKIVRKVKEVKDKESTPEISVKKTTTKKKSVLQSIGHKLEKLTSSKSNSPEKDKIHQESSKYKEPVQSEDARGMREHSLPTQIEPTTESGFIKRAVTLTNVSGVENNCAPSSKTTVSRVLSLFKKFEPKDRFPKLIKAPLATPEPDEKIIDEKVPETNEYVKNTEIDLLRHDKPKRPTSLLLNGLGRSKNKYSGAASDSILVSKVENYSSSDQIPDKNNLSSDIKTINKNNLKFDFSRLPRMKQNNSKLQLSDSVKSNEYCNGKEDSKHMQVNGLVTCINQSEDDSNHSQSNGVEKFGMENNHENVTIQNQNKSDNIENELQQFHPQRNREATTPDKEDIVDRIRRKSFYTRFNEKRQKRKSNLVGPGAQEYNPIARLHSHHSDTKYDQSPTSPVKYDLSPTYANYDVSPTCANDYYKSLNSELPTYSRHNTRLENYGTADRLDAYRSLDRKYKTGKSYVDSDIPRYMRTVSLFENDEDSAEKSTSPNRDAYKYSRTLSMYSPGNYATYRPKRVRNPAIILKESEKEISPENILERIRERKRMATNVNSSKLDSESNNRSNIASKSESDGAECVEKTD